jgi:hypothetical protein
VVARNDQSVVFSVPASSGMIAACYRLVARHVCYIFVIESSFAGTKEVY